MLQLCCYHYVFLCNLFTLAAPVILVQPVSHRGFVTEQIVLSCTADGVPLPDIVWLKNGCPLSTHIAQSTRFMVTEKVVAGFRFHVPEARESTLTLTNSKESDGGEYTCRARNEIDAAYLSTPHSVTVNGAYACLSSSIVPFVYDVDFKMHFSTMKPAEVLVDICGELLPCQNGGNCINRGLSYSCLCLEGWIGRNCDQSKSKN